MKLLNNIDHNKSFQLLIGILGIYFSYLIAGIVDESMYFKFNLGINPSICLILLKKNKNLNLHLDF